MNFYTKPCDGALVYVPKYERHGIIFKHSDEKKLFAVQLFDGRIRNVRDKQIKPPQESGIIDIPEDFGVVPAYYESLLMAGEVKIYKPDYEDDTSVYKEVCDGALVYLPGPQCHGIVFKTYTSPIEHYKVQTFEGDVFLVYPGEMDPPLDDFDTTYFPLYFKSTIGNRVAARYKQLHEDGLVRPYLHKDPKPNVPAPWEDRHGVKDDDDKPKVSEVFRQFPRAILHVAEVIEYGSQKYSPEGWKDVESGEKRYRDALARHLLKEYIEGSQDFESKKLHMAHTAWNALAVLELMLGDK